MTSRQIDELELAVEKQQLKQRLRETRDPVERYEIMQSIEECEAAQLLARLGFEIRKKES